MADTPTPKGQSRRALVDELYEMVGRIEEGDKVDLGYAIAPLLGNAAEMLERALDPKVAPVVADTGVTPDGVDAELYERMRAWAMTAIAQTLSELATEVDGWLTDAPKAFTASFIRGYSLTLMHRGGVSRAIERHDASVAARALEEAADAIEDGALGGINMTDLGTVSWLRARALSVRSPEETGNDD